MKIGDTIKVIDKDFMDWDGKQGRVVAIVRESFVDGYKRKSHQEYIVQFKNPTEWCWFTKKEIKKI